MNTEHDRRVCVYPCYINAKRTVAAGRKIAKDKACENPTAPEIVDCCVMGLKLPAVLEPEKGHPRDFMIRGRARVSLRGEGGSLINPDVPSRKVLLEKVAELVPRHPGRSAKKVAALASLKQPPGASAGPSGAAGTGKGGKGGKKKRK
ncbi:hypothetical protein WJX81_000634 [Elliptochloris bilobata]|uniref:Signal recognition particle 19 kDa protein n=1 Tax=Elliptochloris bilobata TaxID=381761 RepID=A0AAW1SIR3_9CHLO